MFQLSTWQTVGLALFVAWAVFALVFVNCIFPRKLSFLANPSVQNNPQFPAFTRSDFPKWNYFEMSLVGVFLLPLRFATTVLLIVLTWLIVRVLTLLFCVWDFEKPVNCCFLFLAKMTIAGSSRVILWLMGFVCVSKVKVAYRGQNPHLVAVPGASTTISVSNHVSFVDIFYFMAHHGFGFLAKASIYSAPCVGLLAQALQCLFIERMSHDARAAMFEKLARRVEMRERGQTVNQIVIFPEGTTTNNKGLIDFKKGAFVSLRPVRVFALKYQSKFHPQLNMISTLDLFVGICLQLRNPLVVYEFEHPIGPSENSTAEEFAENMKMLMCDEFGFEDYHNTFQEKIDFEREAMGGGKKGRLVEN